MSFDFYKTVIGETSDTTFNFGRKFMLNGSSGQEPTYIDVILSGVSPLTLTRAKANGLNYVKAFGKTEQRNLPENYTQLKYVQNTASTTKVNTGVIPQVGDDIEIRFITPYTAATSNYLLQSRAGTNASIYGISGSQTGKTIILSWGTGNSLTSNITREYNHVYVAKASVIGTTLTLYVKDVTAGTEDTVTGTITTSSDAETPYFIWGNTSQYLSQITPVYYARIVNNGETRLSYVAAKDSNNSASFYDLVNNTFITNFDGTITGSEDLATPTPDTPINIVSNNGVIKIDNNGNIITDGTTETITDSLGNTATAERLLSLEVTDTQEILSGVVTKNTGVKVLDGTESWSVYGDTYAFFRLSNALPNAAGASTSTGLKCTHFVGSSVGGTNENQGIRVYNTAIFLRYDSLYTATSENLPLFKQWLADQYAKGTPVILVYPLATATTESVTGQTLSTKSGTNTITATGSIEGLELEVSFKQQS